MQRAKNGRPKRLAASIIGNTDVATIQGSVVSRVLPASAVYTDEFVSYRGIDGKGYTHKRVNHARRVYMRGDVHTNTIEGFWSLLKRGISGVYHGVSTKHLQSYIDEYVFRYNNRDATGRGMFEAFLSRAVPQKAS